MKVVTTISIDYDIKKNAITLFKKRGISFSKFVENKLKEFIENERGLK